MAEPTQRENSRTGAAVVEVGCAIVLSLAGLLTAWASYQSDLWTGVQQARYTQSGVLRQQAARQQLEADQVQSVEVMVFSAWMNARAADDTALAQWYRDRFPPRLNIAFEEWMKLGAADETSRPSSPFSMAAYQRSNAEAIKADAAAEAAFEAGQSANRTSDSFAQGNVMLAMAMFFAGMCQVFHMPPLRMGLLGVAVLACAIGVFNVASLPMMRPG